MSVLRNGVQGLLRSVGIEIRRARPYKPGNDLDVDIATLVGVTSAATLFDVGANVGQTALRLAAVFPNSKIYSFEPSRDAYARLVENTRHEQRIVAVNLALGSENTSKTLRVHRDSDMSSFLELGASGWGEMVREETVPVASLDDFIGRTKTQSVDLLKVDTQGFDLEVLKGAKQLFQSNAIRLIYVEVNFMELYVRQAFFHDIYLFLIERGFKLVGLYNRNYRKSTHLWWCDALFINPSFASTTSTATGVGSGGQREQA